MRFREANDIVVTGATKPDTEAVLGVDWKVMTRRETAARSERQILA